MSSIRLFIIISEVLGSFTQRFSMHIATVYYVIKMLNVFLTCMHIRKTFFANFLKLTVSNSIKKGDNI